MHDMTCNDCGGAVDASRAGTVRGTWMSTKMLGALWNIGATLPAALECLPLSAGRGRARALIQHDAADGIVKGDYQLFTPKQISQ